MIRRLSLAALAAVCILCVCTLNPQAVPSNQNTIQTLTQPDGTSFRARLFGDERAHWYETLEGYTAVRGPDRTWYFAALDSDGRLIPSGVVVGRGNPPQEMHLRPDGRYLKAATDYGRLSRSEILSAPAITDTQEVVIILVEFSDTPGSEGSGGPHTPAYFDSSTTGLVLGSNQGKMADYFDEVSYGQMAVKGTVANGMWHQSAQTEIYYGADCSPGQACTPGADPSAETDDCNVCIYELARDAILMADTSGFDFAPYDRDGDGVIDHVIIVHAGQNQAALGGSPDDIWSHWSTIPGGEIVQDSLTVANYMVLSEHDVMSTFAHEFTHDLGAPDLYDYDADDDPVGKWCNMGYNFENDRPPHLCGLLKIDIDADFSNGMTGWVTPTLLTTTGSYSIDRLDQNSTNSVYVTDPVFSGGEYFLVENRNRSGYYDYSVPENGLIFTHVDMDMPDGAGRFNDGTPLNSYHGAWVERPLNLPSPDGAAYSSDDGQARFDPSTIPNTNANGGVGTGRYIKNVGAEGNSMGFDVQTSPTTVGGGTTGNTIWQKEDSPFIVTSDVTVASGDTLTIEPGVVVKFNSNRRLVVNGTLLAVGTPADSIVFTSYRDDYHGGDTNGNGPSSGVKGDWVYIHFENASNASVMSYCKVTYAGQDWYYSSNDRRNQAMRLEGATTALALTNSMIEQTFGNNTTSSSYRRYAIYSLYGSLTMTGCVVRDNDFEGLRSEAGPLTVTRSQFVNNGVWGVYATASNVVVDSCRIMNNGSHGLYLPGSNCTVVADTVEANGGRGIYLPSSPAQFTDNIITGNTDWGIYLPADIVDRVWNNNVMTGNGRNNGIEVGPGTISTSTQWIDEHLYFIHGEVAVPDAVTFTLEPGVIVKFYSNSQLRVYGTLLAVGTENDRIVFTAYADDDFGGDTNADGVSSGTRGAWQGLRFESPDTGCELSYCVIRYAGQYHYQTTNDYRYNSIDLSGSGATLTITNSLIEESYGFVTTDFRYRPYTVWGQSGTTLDISDTEIRNNDYRGLYAQGELTLLKSSVHDNGDIGVHSTGASSVVRTSRFENNGSTGLYMTGASAQAVADTFLTNGDYGLYISQPDSFRVNVSSGNTLPEYVVPFDMVHECWVSNVTEVGGEIGVFSGSLTAGRQWVDEHSYVIYGDVTVPHDLALTLEPGTIVKFNRAFDMTINGQLIADGSSSDWITFTSYYDDDYGSDANGDGSSSGTPGDWGHLVFDNTNPGSVMNYCRVRYGGYFEPAVIVNGAGAQLAMTNCVVERSDGLGSYPYGVAAYTGSDLNVTGTQANDNEGYGFYLQEPTTLTTGCSASGNVKNGFYVAPELVGEVAKNNSQSGNGFGNSLAMIAGTITASDDWPKTYTYMVNGNVTVNSGATLQLHKGAVIKFNGNYDLVILGELVSQGDAVEKVVLTSFKDDAYGGDTNEDGNNTNAAAGDWGQLRFDGADSTSTLGWTVLSYAGYGNDPAIRVENCDLNFSEWIIHDNLDRAILVGPAAKLDIHNSDIYGNPSGLENQNTGSDVDARNVWWGHVSGPSGVGPGSGDPVSSYILYDPWLERSIDNPWVSFTSPTTTGNYSDVLIFDLDEDPFMDIIAATEQSGIEVYTRISLEAWQAETSPITSGQALGLAKGDFNNDNHEDLLVCGPFGIRCFQGTGTTTLSETNAPLVGLVCNDVQFAYVNQDQYQDIIGVSGNNGGVWIFYGDGLGNWTPGIRPTTNNTYNRLVAEDLNADTHLDIVATNAEFLGVHVWYGAADSTWVAATPIDNGEAYFGLALGDIDKDGDFDMAIGSSQAAIGIKIYLYDSGSWSPLAGPTTTGIYNDIILADLNGDTRLDIAAASQGGGINVWVGTSSLFWNFWYHPATSNIYNSIDVGDFTLNGSLDLAGASSLFGLALWDNQTPGVFQEYFSTNPSNIAFGPVALTKCAHEDFQLTNVSVDSVYDVVVYSTNPAFEITYAAGGGGPGVGPFDMAPSETVDLRVTYCPTVEGYESEVVIIHSSVAVTNLRVTGDGVPFIQPAWLMDIGVQNASGPPDSAVVTFGGGIGATDSLDTQSGEVCLPPLPPSTVFDVRFLVTGCEGSKVNIHDYYAERDSFILEFQVGAGGYPITVEWNPSLLPEGTFLISDVAGGAIIDTLNMRDTSFVVIPFPIPSSQLSITTFRNSSFAYDINPGWELRSLPLMVEADSLQDIFPEAVSAFTWSGGYNQVHKIAVGSGYWIDQTLDSTVSHLGEQVISIQRNLSPGWSLVGTVYDTILVGDIQQIPSGSITSIFGFDGSYNLATKLIPGQGYWFDINQSCQITITPPFSGSPVSPATEGERPDILERKLVSASEPNGWLLPIGVANRDNAWRTQLTIGFDRRASSGVDLDLGERLVPPWPPSSVSEARLKIGKTDHSYADIRSLGNDLNEFVIVWQVPEIEYPVTISWDPGLIPDGTEMVIEDNMDGRFISAVDMRSTSSLKVDKNLKNVTEFRVSARRGKSSATKPTPFALGQNVPNPFNPTTTIDYSVASSSHVSIQVYDVGGKLIRTLVDRDLPAGSHSVTWNGTNDTGQRVASGVYFYRMTAGQFTQTRKLVLLK